MLDRERVFPEWIKTGLSILLASVSAYWAIRVDLAMTIKDVSFLQATAARHEAAIEKLRESAALAAKQAEAK
jgi:hypothetical protein